MKKIFLLFLIVNYFHPVFSQTNTCCTKSFAALAYDTKFVSAHLDPLPFALTNERGVTIRYKTDDGLDARAYEIRSARPTKKILFVFHEWWGLNEYIKQEAERLQKKLGDVTVYALDLYDGHTAYDAKEAAKLMQKMKEDRAKSIIRGLQKYVGNDAKIATIGWCFGGGWSLQSAILANQQAVGTVMYYGMPETDAAKLKELKGNVLGIFAKNDQWITKEIVQKFRYAMKKAKKNLSVKSYDADHAFANPSNPKFDKEFAEDAHIEAVTFLRNSFAGN